MSFRRLQMTALVACLSLSTAGCSSIGNVFFAPHPASLAEIEPELTMNPGSCDRSEASSQSLAGSAVGVAVGLLGSGLKKEAKRYKASYSATTSSDLEQTCQISLVELDVVDLILELDKTKIAIRVKDGTFNPERVKAKVTAWPLRTVFTADDHNPFKNQGIASGIGTAFGFVNPLMMLHFMWGLFDDDIYKVAYAAKVRIETIDPKTRKPHITELAIPLGKYTIDDIGNGKAKRTKITSGYFGRVDAQRGDLPTNITVSIMEANDVGDVIGQGAELIGDKKDTITDQLKKLLGLD